MDIKINIYRKYCSENTINLYGKHLEGTLKITIDRYSVLEMHKFVINTRGIEVDLYRNESNYHYHVRKAELTEMQLLNNNGFSECQELGRGSFGRVLSSFCINRNEYIAIKLLQKENQAATEECEKEILILSSLKQKNIINFHASFDTPNT